VGIFVGEVVGAFVGSAELGGVVGEDDGASVGAFVGIAVGALVGDPVAGTVHILSVQTAPLSQHVDPLLHESPVGTQAFCKRR